MDNTTDQFKFEDNSVRMSNPVKAGWTVIALALILFPELLAIAGFVLGIVNAARGEVGHGVAQIVCAPVAGVVGLYLGLAAWMAAMG